MGRMGKPLAFLLGTSLIALGCLNLDHLGSEDTDEGAVLINFSVSTSGGKPVPYIGEGGFEIFEDGDSISEYESEPRIVPVEKSYVLYTLVLLDMSGSILESDSLGPLQAAAETYVDSLSGVLKAGIYRFDGRDEIYEVVDFTSDENALYAGIDSLSWACEQEACDPSTDLHGAILDALDVLDEAVSSVDDERIVRASLVVFTDGTDWAERHTKGQAKKAVRRTDYSVYSIGLGGEIDKSFLKKIGKDGFAFAEDTTEISDAFNDIAQAVSDEANSYYTLVYCSPARQGDHIVKVKATADGSSGTMRVEFEADEFDDDLVATCDPNDFL